MKRKLTFVIACAVLMTASNIELPAQLTESANQKQNVESLLENTNINRPSKVSDGSNWSSVEPEFQPRSYKMKIVNQALQTKPPRFETDQSLESYRLLNGLDSTTPWREKNLVIDPAQAVKKTKTITLRSVIQQPLDNGETRIQSAAPQAKENTSGNLDAQSFDSQTTLMSRQPLTTLTEANSQTTSITQSVETATTIAPNVPEDFTSAIAQTPLVMAVRKTNQHADQDSKKAAGWWWFLPFLLIPILGWLGWNLFSIKPERRLAPTTDTTASRNKPQVHEKASNRTQTTAKEKPMNPQVVSTQLGNQSLEKTNQVSQNLAINRSKTNASQTGPQHKAATTENKSCNSKHSHTVELGDKKIALNAVKNESNSKAIDTTTAQQLENCSTDDCCSVKPEQQFEQSPTTSISQTESTTDDLTKIHGIGLASALLLKRSGIQTYAELNQSKPHRLEQILSNAGSQFRLIDTTKWIEQASFAMNRDWSGLQQWQSENVENKLENTPDQNGTWSVAKSEDLASTRSDNLTKIKGIGPATQKFLRKKGIQQFEQLAQMDVQQLTDMFANFESRFQLLDPATWPKQAQAILSQAKSNQQVDAVLSIESNLLGEIQSLSALGADQQPIKQQTPKRQAKSKR